ncbi:MAG: dynamin family protein [Thermodesulfobacteriota bacterium]
MILNREKENLLKETRNLLSDLREAMGRSSAGDADRNALANSISQLDELFLLVVAGEFNSGKSAFINALLGQKIQVEGVTPTTSRIHLLKYGDTPESRAGEGGVWIQSAPIPLLQTTIIVDTPGTNAILREHEILTAEFVPRSDLVLFITSADRPFTESERAFLEKIKSWGKKIVLIINKIDILTSEETEKVVAFVKAAANRLLGDTPEIFAVSSRKAQQAKTGAPDLQGPSGFKELETYIHQILQDVNRFRLKLLNPLGVGQKLIRQQLDGCRQDLDSLSEDLTVLDDIDRQMAVYREDMQRNFKARLGEIDSLLFEMERRGNDFFDEMIRLGRIVDLMRTAKIQLAFEKDVVTDTPQQIEALVSELIDWLVEQDLRQWTSVAEHLERRQRQHAGRVVGQGGPREGTLAYDRKRLVDSIGLATRQAVASYSKERESTKLAESAREAVVNTGLVGFGGAGMGAAIAVLVHTAWADVTGILTGLAAVTLGLLILPTRRQKAKKQLSQKLADLREKLMTGLSEQFDREIRRGVQRIEDAVAPYSRFIRAEKENIAQRRDQFKALEGRIGGLQDQLKEIQSLRTVLPKNESS